MTVPISGADTPDNSTASGPTLLVGSVVFIGITGGAGDAMQSRDSVQAVAGRGLTGDRYAEGVGFYSQTASEGGGRELTLIEAESLDAVAEETGIRLTFAETRRNLTTRGIRLESLIGKQFRIGEVLCEGIKRCVPCVRLEQLTAKPVLKPLVDRGGLRANILESGTIRLHDAITVESD